MDHSRTKDSAHNDPSAVVASKKGAINVLLEATRLSLGVWKPVLVYGAVVEVLVGVLLAPLFVWVLAEALSLARSDVVLNYDIASLALSVEGVVLGLLWTFAFCALAVLALGGLALLTSAACVERTMSLRVVARRVLGSIHRVPGLGALKLSLLVFAVIPLVGAAATAFTALLLAPFGAGPVEHWIPNEVRELAWVVPAGVVLFCVAYALYVRWFLTIHCLMLERVSLTKAVKRSAQLVRGSFWFVVKIVGLHHLTAALALGVLGLLLGLIDDVVVRLFVTEHGPVFRYLVALMLVVNTVAIALATIFFASRGLALGSLLYFRLQGDGVPPGLETDEAAPRLGLTRHRIVDVALILLSLGVATALTAPSVDRALDDLDTAVEVTAHRGYSAEAPENTLAALRLAIEAGADFAEMDFQEAKDGSVVALHDESLARTAGVDRKVWEMTLEELKALDMGASFDERFEGERIPTLDDVLELAKGRIRLNIELKTHGREKDLARSVVDAIHRADFADDCVITSLDPAILARVRALDADLRLGIIVAAKVGRLSRMDVDFYSVAANHATAAFIRKAHRDGRKVHVWTVNEPRDIERVLDRGVDNIITDYPPRVIAILEERSELDELYAAVLRLFRR